MPCSALLPPIGGAPITLQRMLGLIHGAGVLADGHSVGRRRSPAGALMGIKTVLNELIAYLELSKLPADALDPRSRLIMLYAMCGFANFGSLGIMIGGLTTMAPERRERRHLARPEVDRVGHALDLPDGRDRRGVDLAGRNPLRWLRGTESSKRGRHGRTRTGAVAGRRLRRDGRAKSSWRDLREWLALVERNGAAQAHRPRRSIPTRSSPPSPIMATRARGRAGAAVREPSGRRSGARVLANMLGSSKERYALAVGLDPGSVDRRDDRGDARHHAAPDRAGARSPRAQAPVNEVVLRGDEIDLTQFPAPKFWPGDGGRYIGTGDITLTAHPDTGRINVGCYRQMLHGPRRVGLYCSPGKHGLLDREAWWARGKPCEVVAAYGIDPVLFMLAAQVFGIEGIRARRRRRHDGPRRSS